MPTPESEVLKQMRETYNTFNRGYATSAMLMKMAERIAKIVRDEMTRIRESIGAVEKDLGKRIDKLAQSAKTQGTVLAEDLKSIRADAKAAVKSVSAALKRANDAHARLDKIDIPSLQPLVEELESLREALPPQLTADWVRNLLEMLQGDERLEMSAINGLEEKLKELRTIAERKSPPQAQQPIMAGAIGRSLFRDIDLSAQLDGVTKTFQLPAIWNILSVSLSSFPNALRKNVDFTYTNRSITFTSEINAATSLAAGQTCVLTVVNG